MKTYNFHCVYPDKWIHNFDNIQVSVLSGVKDALLEKNNVNENIDPDNYEYDSVCNKIFKRQNKLLCIKGKITSEFIWENESDFSVADLERYVELIKNDKIRTGEYSESTPENAIPHKKWVMSYAFGKNYDTLSDRPIDWSLLTPLSIIRADEFDTRLVCILSDGFDFNIKLLDIDKDETKSVEKQDGTNYVFFSQKCSVNGSEVEQYDIKKLTSNSISITNLGNDLARIVLITR